MSEDDGSPLWWCPSCDAVLPWDHVTCEQRHDGCGCMVLPIEAYKKKLRDAFAEKALQGILTNEHSLEQTFGSCDSDPFIETMVEYAYRYADVMLKERER